jgi:hypothetical protein
VKRKWSRSWSRGIGIRIGIRIGITGGSEDMFGVVENDYLIL